MDDFDLAETASAALARVLLTDGTDPAALADALVTTGLAVWSADTGLRAQADLLIRAWAQIQEATNGG